MTPAKVGDVWYRVEDYLQASCSCDVACSHTPAVRLRVREMYVTKITPKGVWLSDMPPAEGNYITAVGSCDRWVGLSNRKRYACPSINAARTSFAARKQRQLRILHAAVRRAETALAVNDHDAEKDAPK